MPGEEDAVYELLHAPGGGAEDEREGDVQEFPVAARSVPAAPQGFQGSGFHKGGRADVFTAVTADAVARGNSICLHCSIP